MQAWTSLSSRQEDSLIQIVLAICNSVGLVIWSWLNEWWIGLTWCRISSYSMALPTFKHAQSKLAGGKKKTKSLCELWTRSNKKGFVCVIVAWNAIDVIDAIKAGDLWVISPIIAGIKISASSFESISFDYVPRSYNVASHELARLSSCGDAFFEWSVC